MKKILVPIDGSETSKKAAEQAISMGKTFGSEVTFFTVVEVNSDYVYSDLGGMISSDYVTLSESLVKLKMERDRGMLTNVVQQLDCTGVKTTTKIVQGDAREQIVKLAKDDGYDLIVMGHRGLNPIRRIFIGSVAKSVIEDADCNILIVK